MMLMRSVIVVVKYAQMYKAYLRGCVTSKNGTFLSKNALNIASNLLNDTISAIALEEEQKYSQSVYQDCQTSLESAPSSASEAEYQLRLEQQEFISSSTDLRLLNRCIQPETTYSYVSSDLTHPGKFLQRNSTGEFVNQDAISQILIQDCPIAWSTKYPWDVSFGRSSSTCLSQMPSCQIQQLCPPSLEEISAATHYASCDSEWYLHSTIIKFALTILVMICLNVTRVLVVKFLVNYFFRELGTINVEVILNYRFRTMECTLSKEKVDSEITALIKSHKRKALIFLGVSVLCQIPYLFAIIWFSSFSAPLR